MKRRIESECESLENLEDELEELMDDLPSRDEISDERISQIEQEIQRLRGQVQRIDLTAGDLQSVIQFNEQFLEEGQPDFLEGFEDDRSPSGEITDKLVDDTEEVVCWTCGSKVERSQIEETLDRLRTIRNNTISDRQPLKSQIDELKDEKSTLESEQRKAEQIRQKITDVEAEIHRREETLETLRERKAEPSETIDGLGAEVDEFEGTDQNEILEVQRETSRLKVELSHLEGELAGIEDEITTELVDLRTHVEDLQQQAIEEFDNHMAAVLEQLDYDNLERIWIEQTETEVRERRRKVVKDRFDLHIVRSTGSGTVYEDTVDHLSESEREVTGLVFALAGYLVHDVYDHVPFMLLDSIEAIDSNRIARLVDYLAGYAGYLVVALLEEDAAVLDDSYPRIEMI
ncbi:archaea-specific SMC-related protein [Natrinema sp. SYSU A 869]|uniref:archaea-specific SMC-related protein n=1 Tax=Natrinema sp. SYSU A 869 TaxID=2871694 RepID=UPI001CA44B8F|nr:archaea-specific SMC-related protein [Natrinema sp. SYSU A 869]